MDHGMENGGELVGVDTKSKNPSNGLSLGVRRRTRIGHLPRHLLAEILCRLPADSLARCKFVRRSWCGAVDYVVYNPVMVAENFKRSCARPTLLVKSPRTLRRRQRKTIAKGLAGAGFFLDSIIARSGPAFLKSFHSSGSCRYTYECAGIVCLYNLDHSSKIVLLNPSLGLFKVLKRSCLFGRACYYKVKRQYIGFGIDVVKNVYKVVRIIFNGGDNVAEVYTLNPKKRLISWKMISGRTDYVWHGSPLQDQQVSCNGVYYWLGDNRGDQSSGKPILSFDMHSETFGSIHWPEFDEPALPYPATCSLLVWNNRVVLLRYCKEDAEAVPRPIELWVFREPNWSKILTVPPLDYVYCPLTFWNHDELVLKSFSSSAQGHHFASYNILTKTYTRLPWIADLEGKIYVSRYVPSLFWFW